jgi:hypothetical protein
LRGALACIGTPLPGPPSDRDLAAPPAAPIRGRAAASDAGPPAVGMTVRECGRPSLPREGETAREKPLLAPRSRPWVFVGGDRHDLDAGISLPASGRVVGSDAAVGHGLFALPIELFLP